MSKPVASRATSIGMRHSALTAAVVMTLAAGPTPAAEPLSKADAAVWLQRMADASRRMAYEGSFVAQTGGSMRTLFVSNRPSHVDTEGNAGKESRLMAMDGVQREVRCSKTGSLSLVADGGQLKMEKRLNSRHFPDLLPLNAAQLSNWYAVKLGELALVAGLDCRQVELAPKDVYRRGYILCAEKDTALPLKAVMVNETGQPLMQYAFAEIKLGATPKLDAQVMPSMPESSRPVGAETISVRNLPPGFTRISAVKRTLPNKPGEVEHWVFSDGLTHISLFLEPATRPVETVKGQSDKGMINMVTRQVGPMRATILGEAPWAAVETIAMHLEARSTAAAAR